MKHFVALMAGIGFFYLPYVYRLAYSSLNQRVATVTMILWVWTLVALAFFSPQVTLFMIAARLAWWLWERRGIEVVPQQSLLDDAVTPEIELRLKEAEREALADSDGVLGAERRT